MDNMHDHAVEMLHIDKAFNDQKVLDDITFQLERGEIHALLGENGSGKTTLMRILFGIFKADAGEIKRDGATVEINNANDATALKIGMVHQHFELVEVYTALENIVLGAEDTRHGFLRKDLARKKLEGLISNYGLAVDLDEKIENLNVGARQRVEILKMLYRDNDVLIFDEPTAVLTPGETEELLQIMRNLKAEGKSIIFISHKLNELLAVSDRITVIRKGKYIGTVRAADTDEQTLSEMMVGRSVQLEVVKTRSNPGEPVLEVKHLVCASAFSEKNAVNDVSFRVRAGEIVSIAGISGNGQTELIYALTGLLPVKSGQILLCGQDVTESTVRKKSENLSHIPEDRQKHGVVMEFNLADNMILRRYRQDRYQKAGMVKKDAIREYAAGIIEANDVLCTGGVDSVMAGMSGGNQQKAVIGRELDMDRPLIIAMYPTRGVDVGAIEHIHKRLVQERDNGKAVLIASAELSEVMKLADRILVMHEGEIAGRLDPEKTTYEEIGLYMAGAKKDEKEDEWYE